MSVKTFPSTVAGRISNEAMLDGWAEKFDHGRLSVMMDRNKPNGHRKGMQPVKVTLRLDGTVVGTEEHRSIAKARKAYDATVKTLINSTI